jgi:hypothetical protein
VLLREAESSRRPFQIAPVPSGADSCIMMVP